jgi:hypothetical protein
MSIVEKKNKVTAQVASTKVLIADKSDKFNKKKTESLESFNNKKAKVVEFLTDLLTILVGFKILIETIVDAFTYYLTKIEKEIKKGLKIELKSIVSCGLNPSIPDFLKSNPSSTGIVIEVSKIDFFDIFKVDPKSSSGKLLYKNITPNLTDSGDFNTFLAGVLQSPTQTFFWNNTSHQPLLQITFYDQGTATRPNNSLVIKAAPNYDSKKLTDLNNDFINTLTLFNTQGIINRILDSIYGSISFSINKSKKQLINEARINTVIEKIMDADANEVINDSYFTFTNDETFKQEKQATLRQQGIHVLQLSTPTASAIPVSMLTDMNNELGLLNLSTIQQKAVIANNFTKMANKLTEKSIPNIPNIPNMPPIPAMPNIPNMPQIPSMPDNVSIKLSFTTELFKNFTKTIISSVISPKVIMIFLINLKIVYGADAVYEDGVDFIKKNKNIFKSLIKGISTIVIKILLGLALKEISKIVAKAIVKKRIEKMKHRKDQMLSLVGVGMQALNNLASTIV